MVASFGVACSVDGNLFDRRDGGGSTSGGDGAAPDGGGSGGSAAGFPDGATDGMPPGGGQDAARDAIDAAWERDAGWAAPDAGMDAPQATDAGMDATQATDAGMDAPQATDAGMDATPATDGAGPPVTARFPVRVLHAARHRAGCVASERRHRQPHAEPDPGAARSPTRTASPSSMVWTTCRRLRHRHRPPSMVRRRYSPPARPADHQSTTYSIRRLTISPARWRTRERTLGTWYHKGRSTAPDRPRADRNNIAAELSAASVCRRQQHASARQLPR